MYRRGYHRFGDDSQFKKKVACHDPPSSLPPTWRRPRGQCARDRDGRDGRDGVPPHRRWMLLVRRAGIRAVRPRRRGGNIGIRGGIERESYLQEPREYSVFGGSLPLYPLAFFCFAPSSPAAPLPPDSIPRSPSSAITK